MTNTLTANISNKLQGSVTVPGDKSISHRSLIFGSQALGKTKITGLLESEDVLNTKAALQSLSIDIVKQGDEYIVTGKGIGGLEEADNVIDLGNSGTGVRLLMGLVATYPFKTFFTGDNSLRYRPMRRVFKPLQQMGVAIEAREDQFLPCMIHGCSNIIPISYELPVASAQVKSAVLLASINVPGRTQVVDPFNTRDHTELMMQYLGMDVRISEENGSKTIDVIGQKEFKARDIQVPADISSAAFLIVATLITENSEIELKNVLINPTRSGIIDVLIAMGGDISLTNYREVCGEKIADIVVKSSKLTGIKVPKETAPTMIDEYPILGVAASFADGVTVFEGVEELKVKESNRFDAITNNLEKIGADVQVKDEVIIITGKKELEGGVEINTNEDHRIAMSFLVAGLRTKQNITVDSADMISTSFPKFKELMQSIGADIK